MIYHANTPSREEKNHLDGPIDQQIAAKAND